MSVKIDMDSVRETVGSLTHAGAAQTKKMATIARLKTDTMAQKDTIRKAYQAIGKQYYSQMKNHPDPEFADLFAKVNAAMVAIAANEATIEELRADKEIVIDVELKDEDVTAEDAEETAEAEDVEETAEADEAPAEDADRPAEEESAPAEEPPTGEVFA